MAYEKQHFHDTGNAAFHIKEEVIRFNLILNDLSFSRFPAFLHGGQVHHKKSDWQY